MELLSTSLIDWSRAQFAMTAMYHWLFVPLTLGLGVIMAIMETMYVRTGNEQWKKTAKFWMNIFGINFAIGVATGLILEFQFGTNWAKYSYTVGDIFGAPLAIEGIVAFFMEATFISIMFFGWKRVSKKAHLAATWLTITGATISAVWILVANAWMQYPVGMELNPVTMRFEMVDFWQVALSPMAIIKFLHTTISCWVLGSVFVVGLSAWYMLKKRNIEFARQSLKVAATFGLIASLLTAFTGHFSANMVASTQPMKLAAMEGLYEGGNGQGLVAFALLNPDKKSYNDDVDPYIIPIKIPKMLSVLSFNDMDAYVPGIKNIIEGGYTEHNGSEAISFVEKKKRGDMAMEAQREFRKAHKGGNTAEADKQLEILKANKDYYGYSFLETPEQTIPNIPMTYWSFRIMIYLGAYFILLFAIIAFLIYRKKDFEGKKWLLWVCIWTIPLVYVASQTGWIVAEVGRQPWAIQDLLPVQAAASAITTKSVIITFCLFLTLFTGLLIAEVRIMLNQIKKGPEDSH